MTRLFDGMSGLQAGIHGEILTVHPGGGGAVSVTGVIRRTPLDGLDETGAPVRHWQSHLRLPRDAAPALGADDVVIDGQGTRYIVLGPAERGRNPGADGFDIFRLRLEPTP